MGGQLFTSMENEILTTLRQDNPKRLKDYLLNNNINRDVLYTPRKRTLIQLCCYYSSPKCLSQLIDMNYDYNEKEISNNYTPLYIACKFNCLAIVKILLSREDCKILQKNYEGLNEFEIAFLKGNYDICYYLLFEYKNNNNNKINEDNDKNNNINNINNDENNINENENDNDISNNIEVNNDFEDNKNIQIFNRKDNNNNDILNINYKAKGNININKNINKQEKKVDIDANHPYQKYFFYLNYGINKYISLYDSNEYPLFNIELFYDSLCKKIPPGECGSFALEGKRTKDLREKIPDPNESWGHFFKRLVKLELYNPPLVERSSFSQINSLYMNAQMKLLENEYGIKMSYSDQKKDKNKNTNNQNNNNNININSINNKSEEESLNKNNSREVLDLDDIEINTRRALKQQENDGHNNNDNTDDNSVKIFVNKRNKGRTLEDLNPENKQHFNTLDLSDKSSERKIKYNKTEYDDK